jgi:hypothetical protein
MSTQPTIQMSQGLEIIQPRSGKAYPIPCDEWLLLKGNISGAVFEPWLCLTIGSLLLGAAVTTVISILLGAFDGATQHDSRTAAWAVFATTLITGAVCLYFAGKERQVVRKRMSDVVAQMSVIERRYEQALQKDGQAVPPYAGPPSSG